MLEITSVFSLIQQPEKVKKKTYLLLSFTAQKMYIWYTFIFSILGKINCSKKLLQYTTLRLNMLTKKSSFYVRREHHRLHVIQRLADFSVEDARIIIMDELIPTLFTIVATIFSLINIVSGQPKHGTAQHTGAFTCLGWLTVLGFVHPCRFIKSFSKAH